MAQREESRTVVVKEWPRLMPEKTVCEYLGGRSPSWVRARFRKTAAFVAAFKSYDRVEIDRMIDAEKTSSADDDWVSKVL